MSNKTKFMIAMEHIMPTLNQFVPIVDRVHGDHHPEFHEVRRLFDAINAKTEASNSVQPNLDTEFAHLREVTNNFVLPEDVCESYEAVYDMFKELHDVYLISSNTL